MKAGLTIFPTTYSMQPADLARAAEQRGFESLWFPEHTHIPAKRVSPWPGGGDLPQEYCDTYDPFVALSFAAAATTRLLIGTGICLVVERDPISLAKEVASLDRLSGGRLLFGVGGGWNAEEMANHGTAFEHRFAIMRERVEAMKAIWSQERAEYHGEHVDFDPILANPAPLQRPHPPILVAGAAPWGPRRAARYGDGWMPLGGPHDPVQLVKQLRDAAEAAGRASTDLTLSLFGAPTRPERLAALRDAGVDRVIFFLPPDDQAKILPRLDRYRQLMADLGEL